MISPYAAQFLTRLRTAIDPSRQEQTLVSWIPEYTRLGGRPFSFVDHEYQQFILSLNSPWIAVKKCSQIGISELNVRRALGVANLNANCALAYILPSASFAQLFAKTRVDPVLDGSPELRLQLSPGNDSSLMKRFINDSFIYFRGASRSGMTISIPLDALIYDELDFVEDVEVLTQYTSRLTHSRLNKAEFFLSTPTVPGYGISAKFDESRQFHELQKCNHCNFWFSPDYFEHVRLPGFKKDLKRVTYHSKSLITGKSLKEAYLSCPKCGKKVDQGVANREFVCKNPESKADMVGVHITPFCAPNVVTPGDLIRMSTHYVRTADFYNFGLGLDYADKESAVTLEELEEARIGPLGFTPTYTVMGLDMGGLCAATIGYPVGDQLVVIHSELIPLAKVKTRYFELCSKYRVICTVADGMPYTDIIMYLQGKDPNCWAALFSESKDVQLYRVKQREEDEQKAFYGLRVVDLARDRVLDATIASVRAGNLKFVSSEETSTIFKHMRDLKRIRIQNRHGEDVFTWRKSANGIDHYFFSSVYVFIASCIRGTSGGTAPLPVLASKFRHKGRL